MADCDAGLTDRNAAASHAGGAVGALTWLRSWVYLIAFVLWTTLVALGMLPGLACAAGAMGVIRTWARGVMVLARAIVGIRCRVEGLEHLPRGACVVASQHQSAFETYRFFIELPHAAMVLKRELVAIPVLGWYMRRAGLIAIDRGAGLSAMRQTLRAARAALAAGRQVVIFPEGTRTPPGVVRAFRPGVAALYRHAGVPVIPVVLNAGCCWGKTRVLKVPGTITMRYLPALKTGLGKEEVLSELRAVITREAEHLPPPFAVRRAVRSALA
jgi:1-acyl-sn-glycerol-3-phosphate acyltransferase